MRADELRGLVMMGAVALAVSACGSSHASTTTHGATPTAAAAASPTTSVASVTPPRAPHLRIVSPRPGARVTPTLTIRVSLSSAAVAGPHAFRYVLDGSLTRVGSRRLTFRGLAPGAHHVLVALAKRPSVKAHVSFIVPASVTPAPAPAPTTTSTPPPTTTAASTPPPAPATTQATAPAPSPAPSGGIPQGAGAGDDDSDNHGGPSDGDGNI